MIYLDNAATSWPKPPEVLKAIARFMEKVGANPGRSGHRLSIAAGRVVDATRESLAELLGVPDPLRVIFTSNATEAINLALRGLLRPGQHVVTSSVEHNAMMRPLRALEQEGVRLTVVGCKSDGSLDPTELEAAIRPETVMIALNQASNVVGTLLPVAEAGRIARQRDLTLLVDAAGSAGVVPIDLVKDRIDLLAITGHKSLYGPTGTGALVFGERIDAGDVRPLQYGGTGSHSESEEQPEFLPDAFESGTLNATGLAGLDASVRWLRAQGITRIRERQINLVRQLIHGLQEIPRVKVYGTGDARRQLASVVFNITDQSPSEVGFRLDDEFGVLCRVGLHCSPAAHRTIGTFPEGAVRFAPGVFTTEEELNAALHGVAQLARGR